MKHFIGLCALSVVAVSCAGKSGEETSASGADAQSLKAAYRHGDEIHLFSFDNNPATPNTRCWYLAKVEKGTPREMAYWSADPLLARELPDASLDRRIKTKTGGYSAATAGGFAALFGLCPAMAPTTFTPVGAALFATCYIAAGLGTGIAGAHAAKNVSSMLVFKDAPVADSVPPKKVALPSLSGLVDAISESSKEQTGNSCWPGDKVFKSLKLD